MANVLRPWAPTNVQHPRQDQGALYTQQPAAQPYDSEELQTAGDVGRFPDAKLEPDPWARLRSGR